MIPLSIILIMQPNAQPLETKAPPARRVRRETMVAAAREMFIAHGYGQTAMSAVAAKVGGSKTTLWAYFPSKEALFEAVVDDLVERFGSLIENVPLEGGDVEATLRQFGRAVAETVASSEVLGVNRMVIGEAGRFPELAELYQRKGPGRAQFRLTAFIEMETQAGRLHATDPANAAAHFLAMCQANHIQQCLLNQTQADRALLHRDVDAAITAFLAAYAISP